MKFHIDIVAKEYDARNNKMSKVNLYYCMQFYANSIDTGTTNVIHVVEWI